MLATTDHRVQARIRGQQYPQKRRRILVGREIFEYAAFGNEGFRLGGIADVFKQKGERSGYRRELVEPLLPGTQTFPGGARDAAWSEWWEMPFEARAAICRRAADLLAGPWRSTVNAATRLGQSKTCYQAEIDSACAVEMALRASGRSRTISATWGASSGRRSRTPGCGLLTSRTLPG